MIRSYEVNLHQLRLFTAVVRTGSFTQAAREHFISQSALSAQIRELSSRVGAPLFGRVRGAVVPSEAGRHLFHLADSLLQHADMCTEAMRHLGSATIDSVAVGVSPTGAFYPLVEALHQFRLHNPGIIVRLSIDATSALLASVRDGALDFALDWEPVRGDDLDCEPLAEAEFFIVVSPRNPAALRAEMSAGTFVDGPFFTLRHGLGTHSFVEAMLARSALWPKSVTYLPSIDDVKRAVAADLGFGLVSELAARQELQAKRLVAVRLERFELRRRLLLIHRNGSSPSEAAGQFRTFLLQSPTFR